MVVLGGGVLFLMSEVPLSCVCVALREMAVDVSGPLSSELGTSKTV